MKCISWRRANLRKSLIGWAVLGLSALVWEMLGVFGVDGIWPLTDLVWHNDRLHPTTGPMAILITVVGGGAWLVYHFLVQRHRKV